VTAPAIPFNQTTIDPNLDRPIAIDKSYFQVKLYGNNVGSSTPATGVSDDYSCYRSVFSNVAYTLSGDNLKRIDGYG